MYSVWWYDNAFSKIRVRYIGLRCFSRNLGRLQQSFTSFFWGEWFCRRRRTTQALTVDHHTELTLYNPAKPGTSVNTGRWYDGVQMLSINTFSEAALSCEHQETRKRPLLTKKPTKSTILFCRPLSFSPSLVQAETLPPTDTSAASIWLLSCWVKAWPTWAPWEATLENYLHYCISLCKCRKLSLFSVVLTNKSLQNITFLGSSSLLWLWISCTQQILLCLSKFDLI